jgi:hypothetical protein
MITTVKNSKKFWEELIKVIHYAVDSQVFEYFLQYDSEELIAYSPSTTKTKLNSVACSPQANYTDRAAAACQRS